MRKTRKSAAKKGEMTIAQGDRPLVLPGGHEVPEVVHLAMTDETETGTGTVLDDATMIATRGQRKMSLVVIRRRNQSRKHKRSYMLEIFRAM